MCRREQHHDKHGIDRNSIIHRRFDRRAKGGKAGHSTRVLRCIFLWRNEVVDRLVPSVSHRLLFASPIAPASASLRLERCLVSTEPYLALLEASPPGRLCLFASVYLLFEHHNRHLWLSALLTSLCNRWKMNLLSCSETMIGNLNRLWRRCQVSLFTHIFMNHSNMCTVLKNVLGHLTLRETKETPFNSTVFTESETNHRHRTEKKMRNRNDNRKKDEQVCPARQRQSFCW